MDIKEKSAIIVFAKYPSEGKVKTRLGASFGNQFAIAFYKLCAEHTFNVLEELKDKFDCYLYYGTEDNIQQIKKWVYTSFGLVPQVKGDLGEKMLRAFQDIFSKGYKKVIIIGTDIPDITREKLVSVFNELDNFDVVISPSYDGGYVLLGMTSLHLTLFKDIKWSTNEVFNKTIQEIKKMDLSVKIKEAILDIDDGNDLIKWLSKPNEGNIKLKSKIRHILNKERN